MVIKRIKEIGVECVASEFWRCETASEKTSFTYWGQSQLWRHFERGVFETGDPPTAELKVSIDLQPARYKEVALNPHAFENAAVRILRQLVKLSLLSIFCIFINDR